MQNETIKSIMERRSTRAYEPEQIKDEELQTIIECGLWAPSAMNLQSWHFTVIQNADLIDWMNEQVRPKLPPEATERMKGRFNGRDDFSIFYGAPTLILVSGDSANGSAASDCGFATENMCLAAHSLGIGSCIVGLATLVFDDENAAEYIEELGVPSGYKPFYAIALGYPAMEMPKPARVDGKVNYIK